VPAAIDLDRLRADTRQNITDTNAVGRALCARLLEIASGRADRGESISVN